jgi:hypothetical protein
MKKRILPLVLSAVTLPLALSSVLFGQSPTLPGPVPTTSTKIGPVNLSWTMPGDFSDDQLNLRGVVHMTSTSYDLQARSLVALFSKSNSGLEITKATATGDPAKNVQVIGRFEAPEGGRTYLIDGDQAVYVPDASRKGGGRIDFTGNVVVTLQSPKDLSGPGVMKTGQATVLVGAGAEYPKVQFGAGTLTFTPLQK